MPGMMWIQTIKTLVIMSLVTNGIDADTCGQYEFSELIVGGEPVLNPSEWPWIVGLFHNTDNITEFKCGATLVSKNVVVTAAHCVVMKENSRFYKLVGDEIMLAMGRINIQNWTVEENVQTRNAQNVVIHPSYLTSRKNGTDIAYIVMDSPISITDFVSPVCLWNDESDSRLTEHFGTVVGWGKDENNVSVTETPRKTTRIPIVDKQTCHASNGLFRHGVKDHQFCAGKQDGTGPCNGDSGSGLYVTCTQPDGEMSWVLRGLVSRSVRIANIPGSCDLNNYIIYTDVAKLVPWMKNTSCSFRHPQTFGALNMTRLGEKYYYVQLDWQKSLIWTSAQQFCRSHGLQLASVETEEENKLIAEYIRGKMPEDWLWWGFWLSGSDSQQEGTWRWSNGHKLNFTDWGQEVPNSYHGDWDYLLMVVRNDGTHLWWDLPCSVERSFMCELEDVCS